ncbi:conserved hypothetical protein [Stenotrophomonas thermophila]|nr:conserved hypothetical protein [Stenotrophomonas maltophilia]
MDCEEALPQESVWLTEGPTVTEFWSKRQVRTRLGFRTDAELARFFGISRSAVSQWPRDFPIPPLRQYILHQRYPNLFPTTEARADESI